MGQVISAVGRRVEETAGPAEDGPWEAKRARAEVAAWRASGQTLAEYCRVRGTNYHRLYWWKRKFEAERATPANAIAEQFAPVMVKEAGALRQFDTASTAGDDAGVELLMENGRRIRVARGFDADTLRRLLAVAEERAC